MAKILYIGPLRPGSTTLQRMVALQELGHEIEGIDSWQAPPPGHPLALMDKVANKAYRGGSPIRPKCRDWIGLNQSILSACRSNSWNFLWIDKGLAIEPETLAEVKHMDKGTRIVGYSPDDMLAKHNHSRQFLDGLTYYDTFFTTKSFNVAELTALGCPAVFFVDNAFDPNTHKPMTLSADERQMLGGNVGFIGSYERERAYSMRLLAQAGISLRVYGGNWVKNGRKRIPGLQIEGRTVLGEDYARVVCAFDINLHFLRKINRDQQTTRSIEIPACAQMMIAERTEEHLALFIDGEEAIFFDSDEELLDKTKYYMKHPVEAKKIGWAGRSRCLRSGYSNRERLQQMLKKIDAL